MRVFKAILPSAKKSQDFFAPLGPPSSQEISQSIARDRFDANACHLRALRMKESYQSLLSLSLQASEEEKLLRRQLSHVNAAEKRILEIRALEEAAKARRLFTEANTVFIELQKTSARIRTIDRDLSQKRQAYSLIKRPDGPTGGWKNAA